MRVFDSSYINMCKPFEVSWRTCYSHFLSFSFPSSLHANIQHPEPPPSPCELHNAVPLCVDCVWQNSSHRTREGWQTFSTTMGYVHATAVATGVLYKCLRSNINTHSHHNNDTTICKLNTFFWQTIGFASCSPVVWINPL